MVLLDFALQLCHSLNQFFILVNKQANFLLEHILQHSVLFGITTGFASIDGFAYTLILFDSIPVDLALGQDLVELLEEQLKIGDVA